MQSSEVAVSNSVTTNALLAMQIKELKDALERTNRAVEQQQEEQDRLAGVVTKLLVEVKGVAAMFTCKKKAARKLAMIENHVLNLEQLGERCRQLERLKEKRQACWL